MTGWLAKRSEHRLSVVSEAAHIPLDYIVEKKGRRSGKRDPAGRRLTMSFVISKRTFNVRISISTSGFEIEISVQ